MKNGRKEESKEKKTEETWKRGKVTKTDKNRKKQQTEKFNTENILREKRNKKKKTEENITMRREKLKHTEAPFSPTGLPLTSKENSLILLFPATPTMIDLIGSAGSSHLEARNLEKSKKNRDKGRK